jgi:2-dehydro-3-deoxyphosphogluconate aldolase/(4S)-4-hydroxy-2-oxoglutarate aldolase
MVQRIADAGLIAIIRADSSAGLIETCRALAAGGITVAEVTMTTPGALECIAAARKEFADTMLIGVGSVISGEVCRKATDAGAQFVVAPTFKPEVVDAAHAAEAPCFAGALSPTEILTAFEYGSDVVKVFPANHFGPKYFKDVLAPMPHLKLTPTGGVDLSTIHDWFDAGAVCLGVGSALVKKDLIRAEKWDELTALAKQFVTKVSEARS